MSGLYIERNELLAVLSESLDRVEMEVLHVTQHHAKRVAWLCVLMGKKLYMTEEEISDLVASALLHDSAFNFPFSYSSLYSFKALSCNKALAAKSEISSSVICNFFPINTHNHATLFA